MHHTLSKYLDYTKTDICPNGRYIHMSIHGSDQYTLLYPTWGERRGFPPNTYNMYTNRNNTNLPGNLTHVQFTQDLTYIKIEICNTYMNNQRILYYTTE